MALLNVASALLALLNIELPLEANPPIPSPFGLCSKTKRIKRRPDEIHIQEIILIMVFMLVEELFWLSLAN